MVKRKAVKRVKQQYRNRVVGFKLNDAPNQAVRVLLILRWLHDNVQGLTVADILAKLAESYPAAPPVDKRQINRDIAFLRAGSIKINEENIGRSVLYSIAANDRLAAVDSMKNMLPVALKLLEGIVPQNKSQQIEQVMKDALRISAIDGDKDVLASYDLMISLQSGTWQQDVNSSILADSIAAIAKEKWALLQYGSSVAKELRVYPHKLTVYLGRLYLIGYLDSSEEYRTFAVDKIYSIRPDPAGGRKHKFNEDDMMRTRWGIWSSLEDPNNPSRTYKVVVEIEGMKDKPYMMNEFSSRRWHPSQKPHTINENKMRLEFQCGVSGELVSWVLRWAPHIKVIEPAFLKKEVKKRAAELLKKL